MSTRFSKARRLLVMGAVGGAALVAGRRLVSVEDGDVAQFGGAIMGTRYTVKIGERVSSGQLHQLARSVHAAFDDVDRGMSIFRPESEVSRFNRAGRGPFVLSAELLPVLIAAHQVSRWSGGAFDITVAPLVEQWGFGTEKRFVVPPAAELHALRAAVDWRALHIDAARRVAFKAQPAQRIDLGGIAKGHGVDRAAAAVELAGVRNYMVELGGEIRAAGVNAAGNRWRIGIEEPDAMPRRARHLIALSGQAVATSGDYRIYFEQGGRRYSHEIDPATGEPITHGLASVTVIADECMQADALTTALIVLGPERGFALAQASGVAAQFTVRTRDGALRDRTTSAFATVDAQTVQG